MFKPKNTNYPTCAYCKWNEYIVDETIVSFADAKSRAILCKFCDGKGNYHALGRYEWNKIEEAAQ